MDTTTAGISAFATLVTTCTMHQIVGVDLGFIQIAGLVARRIVCDVKVGEPVRAGQVFGLIRFGSRMDVFLPDGVAPLVVPYQTTVAGETVIADLQSDEPARQGEER